MKSIEDFSQSDLHILRHKCLEKHLTFTRFFFKHRENTKFIVSPHHKVMCDAIDKVFSGEYKRLIINVPPGYTKTEIAVVSMVARGLAINPSAKFIHSSYADMLASTNSMAIRDVILSEEYQALWPMKLRKDTKSKRAWHTSLGGQMLAVASGSTVTGFRAGRMVPGFSGAIIIDDPLKPDDAYSEPLRKRINNRVNNTFLSRKANPDIPIIVIMQRLHEDDMTGFLLRGGTGEKWHHLILPVEIDSDFEYPTEYTHGIHIDHNLLPGALWEYKHDIETIAEMKATDPYTTASQYFQNPVPLGGGIYKDEWWRYYDPMFQPPYEYRIITVDTAQKTAEHNDYTVFQCWGYFENKAYLLDVLRAKWESPDIQKNFKAFLLKHTHSSATNGRCRGAYIEDKQSGTDLIQSMSRDPDVNIAIFPLQRDTDKVRRAMDNVPYCASGRVYLPENAPWLSDFKEEMRKFTPLMTHKHDDQVDAFNDGVETLLHIKNEAGAW